MCVDFSAANRFALRGVPIFAALVDYEHTLGLCLRQCLY